MIPERLCRFQSSKIDRSVTFFLPTEMCGSGVTPFTRPRISRYTVAFDCCSSSAISSAVKTGSISIIVFSGRHRNSMKSVSSRLKLGTSVGFRLRLSGFVFLIFRPRNISVRRSAGFWVRSGWFFPVKTGPAVQPRLPATVLTQRNAEVVPGPSKTVPICVSDRS